jgi:flagellar protein FlaG
MDFNLPPIGGPDRRGGAAPAARAPERDKDFKKVLAEVSDARIDTVPATPPPDVREQVERASGRYDELRDQGRELHFATDEKSGRLVIEVRDLDGTVIRTIPPSKALDVISGENLD